METINSRSLSRLKLLSCSGAPIFSYRSITFTGSNCCNFSSPNLNLSFKLRRKDLALIDASKAEIASSYDYGRRWLLQSAGNREQFQPLYLFRKVGPVKPNARRRKDPSTKKKETPVGLRWLSPETPWVKVNTDGCSKGSPGKSAAGGLIRDSEGEWKVGFSGNLGFRDSLMAELEAATFGLELAWNRGYRNVILETDSAAVVEYLVKESIFVPSQYGDLVKKCVELKSKDWDCRVEHVKRDANMCADRLAEKALKRAVGWVVFDDPPQEVLVELDLDRGGFTWPKWDKF